MIPLLEKAHTLALTETEKEILEYFETHLPGAVALGLQDLSEILYTSNATIVRFCQKLGLHGYNDFKYQVRQELTQQYTDIQLGFGLINRSVAQFRDNLELLDVDRLSRAAEILTGGRSVYIYGQNLSSLPAQYLKTAMINLDYPSILIDWPELLDRMSQKIDSNSVLFILSARGEPERFRPILENVRARGAVSILLTCDLYTPLEELCDICLFANDENLEFRRVDVNPRFGMFTVIQILIEMIAHRTLA